MGILAAADFAAQCTYYRTKENPPGQLVFGRDMITPINHVADWRYTCQRKKTQINKDVDCENTTRIDYDYRVGDKITTKMRSAYKYETKWDSHLTKRSGYTQNKHLQHQALQLRRQRITCPSIGKNQHTHNERM